jgi:hypothetical protein
MNNDEIKSLIVKVLILVLSSTAGALHQNLGAASVSAIATDLADLAVLAYGIYDHWNMKKVHETALGPKAS